MSLEMRPDCERCGTDLPAYAPGAFICSFECTFCAECAEALILGLSAFPAYINLLDDDCQFEIGECHVKVHGGEVTGTFLRIDFHEGLSTYKTG